MEQISIPKNLLFFSSFSIKISLSARNIYFTKIKTQLKLAKNSNLKSIFQLNSDDHIFFQREFSFAVNNGCCPE